MAVVKNLLVRVGADFSELQKEMAKAGKFMKSAGKELTQVGKSLTVGVTLPIVGIGAAAVKAASDLKEVQNVVDTAFGDSAKEVDAWAKTAIKSYGLSELQAKQFAGTMRAMTGSMGLSADEADKMSMNLSALAGDMASFYNLDPTEAFDKLRSGISGETEPLKQLGINMSVANLEAYALTKGINKSWKEMSQAEQATLRYSYIMDATKMAQGDFAKTNTGFANSMRVVKEQLVSVGAQLGGILLPYLEKFLGKVRELLEGFQGLSPSMQENIVKFALLAAAIGPLIMIIGTLLTTVSKLLMFGKVVAGALAGIQAGTLGVGAAMTTVFGPAGIVLLVIAAIAALVAGLVWLWNNNETFKNGLIAIWNAIYTFLEPLILAIKELLVSTWETINAVLTVIFNVIKALALQVFSDLKNFWAYWGQDITNYFMNMWNTISGVFKGAINVVSGLMKVITGILTGDWNKALEGMKQVASGIWEAIKAIFRGGANGIIGAVNFMIGGLNSISIDVPDWVPLAGGKHFGLSIPKIPMLANGGIATGPTLAMIGEGREDEAIMPLSKLQMLLDKNNENKQAQSYNGPLFVIENFENKTDTDIETLMYQMEFYRQKASKALGGE